jgi:maltose alpha-D-glucosyltransferase/alpha-amylase
MATTSATSTASTRAWAASATWSSSSGPPTSGDPAVPLVTDGLFGPDRVNVADQRRDPTSLLNWTERAIRARKELPELGWGAPRVLKTDQPAVLAHRCDWLDATVLALHNFSPEKVEVTVELGDDAGGRMTELLGDQAYDSSETGRPLTLGGFGYRWLRLRH